MSQNSIAARSAISPQRFKIALSPDVTTPDWSVVTSSIVGDVLEAVFETSDWEERWADLDEDEDLTRRAILKTYALRGHAPSIDELASTTGLTADQVQNQIVKLAARDMVVLDLNGKSIIGAYPFIDRKTEHRVYVGDITVNAMCAIDALGTGAMLGVDVMVKSACRHCGTPVQFQTREQGEALVDYAPAETKVWAGIQYSDKCAADSLCKVMAFFCSNEHLDVWQASQGDQANGFRLSMQEGFQLGKAIFRPLLASHQH
jgi:mercuric reductase